MTFEKLLRPELWAEDKCNLQGKTDCPSPNTHFISQSISMSSQAGKLIYSWNSSNWELLATMPQSTGYCPQHHEVPTRSFADEISPAASVTLLTSVCSAVLPFSFPDDQGTFGGQDLCLSSAGTAPLWLTLRARSVCGHQAIPCFKQGLKQGLRITE